MRSPASSRHCWPAGRRGGPGSRPWTADLVDAFEADHERPPTRAERLELAQQATLDAARRNTSPSEQNNAATWHAQAVQLLGRAGLDRMLQPRAAAPVVDRAWIAPHTAQQVINTVEAERSSWTPWNIRAETLRQVRAAGIRLDQITACGSDHRPGPGRRLDPDPHHLQPAGRTGPLLRPDGTPVYEQPTATRYTSRRILYAERRLVDTAGRLGGRQADHNSVTLALLLMANGNRSTPPNRTWSATWPPPASGCSWRSPRRGKTTAMRALATAWTSSGGTVVGLAPSAAAAEQLRTQLGEAAVADNLAKLAWAIAHHEPLAAAVGPDTLVIIDEAGMADTLSPSTTSSPAPRPRCQRPTHRRRPTVGRDLCWWRPARHRHPTRRLRRTPRSLRFADPAEALWPRDPAATGARLLPWHHATPPPAGSSPPGAPTSPTGSMRSCSPTVAGRRLKRGGPCACSTGTVPADMFPCPTTTKPAWAMS